MLLLLLLQLSVMMATPKTQKAKVHKAENNPNLNQTNDCLLDFRSF